MPKSNRSAKNTNKQWPCWWQLAFYVMYLEFNVLIVVIHVCSIDF